MVASGWLWMDVWTRFGRLFFLKKKKTNRRLRVVFFLCIHIEIYTKRRCVCTFTMYKCVCECIVGMMFRCWKVKDSCGPHVRFLSFRMFIRVTLKSRSATARYLFRISYHTRNNTSPPLIWWVTVFYTIPTIFSLTKLRLFSSLSHLHDLLPRGSRPLLSHLFVSR